MAERKGRGCLEFLIDVRDYTLYICNVYNDLDILSACLSVSLRVGSPHFPASAAAVAAAASSSFSQLPPPHPPPSYG